MLFVVVVDVDDDCCCTGAPADTAGGEDEDGWHGDARGEERRCAGALQRPQRFPLQTGQIPIPFISGGGNSGKTQHR